MNFRVALAAAALIAVSSAAHAQTSTDPRPVVDRIVVDIAGKPMSAVRAELSKASEAVCRSEGPFGMQRDADCVLRTYVSALQHAKLARRAAIMTPAVATQVASR